MAQYDFDESDAVMIGCGDLTDPDTGERLDWDDTEQIIQCCSCERTFVETDLSENRECPYCHSGNWVFGYIDDISDESDALDCSADAEALASAGYGTDEDYFFCGEFD